MDEDIIAKGHENRAISKEKRDLIYKLSKNELYKHPKLIVQYKIKSSRKGSSTKNRIKTERTKRYHHLSGKVNYTKIAKRVGVSVYTVIRYLKCRHKKAREPEGEYHQSYLKSLKTGQYKKMQERAKKDREKNPKKWGDMAKKWLAKNKDKKRAYDKKQYDKKYPILILKCTICGKKYENRKCKHKAPMLSCKNCRKEYWKIKNRKYYQEKCKKSNQKYNSGDEKHD